MSNNFSDEEYDDSEIGFSKFNYLSDDELVAILKKGFFSEDDFGELLYILQKRKMKGAILSAVTNEEERIKASEYLSYHDKLPKTYPVISEEVISWAKEILLKKDAGLEDKKVALITLAHVGRLDVYQALENYAKKPNKELKVWINMAIQECQTFMKSDILEKPVMDVSLVSDVERDDPCTCGSGRTYRKCCGK